MPPFESSSDPLHLQRKPVAVFLKGNRTLHGQVHIAEGQSLTAFLAMKKDFLNLTSARWEDASADTPPLPHLSLRMSNLVWVVPEEGSLYLTSAVSPTQGGREAELHVIGGLVLHVTLNIADELRMSDYFDSGPAFIPLRNVRVLASGRVIDRMAMTHESILAIREL